METSDFKRGDRVRYVPVQADGDPKHSDCADGKVTHTKGKHVFMRFDEMQGKPMKGKTPETPLAVSPENLIRLVESEKEEKDIEIRAKELPEQIREIIVTDDESLARAGRAKVYCRTIRLGIIEKFKKSKKAANDAHKEIVKLESDALKYVAESEYYINNQIGDYTTKLRLIREEAEKAEKERKEAEEKKEEEIFQKALEAENAGEQKKAIEIIEETTEPKTPIYVPPKRKIEGVHMRKNYDVWVDDISLLPDEYIIKTADLLKIKAFAMKHPGTPEMPGVRFVRKDIVV